MCVLVGVSDEMSGRGVRQYSVYDSATVTINTMPLYVMLVAADPVGRRC